jgi:hypothetical protein
MTPYGSRTSDGQGCTPFEQELVSAMNDFVNGEEAPHFDTAAITRGARRRQATAIAGIAAALVVVGAGTALAAVNSGTHESRPASASHATVKGGPAKSDAAVLQYGEIRIELAGVELKLAKAVVVGKAQLKLGTVSEASPAGCKPGSVVAVSPHAPKVVHKGDTVNLTVCAG